MDITKSSRFKDAPWFPGTEKVICLIGGAGGIGSWLAMLLARAGYLPYVLDFDTLEEHNLGGQLFGKHHIGKPKVQALSDMIHSYTDTSIMFENQAYTEDTTSHTFVFSAFDNMKARTDMFNNWVKYVETWKTAGSKKERTPIFIDGRLTMEQLQIFCVTPDRIDKYKEHLFDDTEVPDAPCTMKQTSHSAAMIASHMTAFFTNHYANLKLGDTDRNIPFMYEYFIPINYLNEEV